MSSLPAWFRRNACVLTGAAVALCGAVALGPTAASATGVPAPGTIVYILNDNVYLTTPTRSATVQVTTDGSVATKDGTGDTPYSVPSESDDGLIVAVRNQQFDKGKPSEYTQGVIWEMDRSGHLVRKFKPAQFNHIAGGSCNPAVLQLPLGIYNAVVSPNGKYIAYTAQTYVQSASCSAVEGYSSWIANIDGSGARMIADTGGNTASLEIGHFTADSSRLLVDRADFGSIETYYVNVPGSTAQPWTEPASGDFIDQAYQQADVRNGVMATNGYSHATSSLALRLWTFSDFAHQPTAKCDWTSTVNPNSID
ncbi:MAG TPA: hypothetical protein VHC23_10160 [Jatrophihabitans sp.]|nr:hypothetical protein [Jatrophihabitans sp.]